MSTAYLRKGREAEYQREWHEKNPGKSAEYNRNQDREKVKAYKRGWDARNPEKLLAYKEKQKAKYCSKTHRDKNLKRLYGLSQVDFDALLARQGGKCAACSSPRPGGQNWQVDHDHDTGRVRGILCKGCNIGLGQLGDDPYRVSALLNYLQP